jgi:hypothetical protein
MAATSAGMTAERHLHLIGNALQGPALDAAASLDTLPWERGRLARPPVQAGKFPENREFNSEFSISRLVRKGQPACGRDRLEPGPGRVRHSSAPANAASFHNARPGFCLR